MSTLEKAIRIATEVHEGQLDKGGQPYILHCLRVMLAMPTTETQIVAVLHDVLEDSSNSNGLVLKLYQDGFSSEIVKAVQCLTRDPIEAYMQYIKRVSKNPIAKIVKIADLKDNSNIYRISNPTEADNKRILKYLKAKAFLEEC